MHEKRLHPTDILTIVISLIFALASLLLYGSGRSGLPGVPREKLLFSGLGLLLVTPAVLLASRFVNGKTSRIAGWARLFYPQLLYSLFFSQAILVSQFVYEGKSLDSLAAAADLSLFGYQPALKLYTVFGGSPAATEIFFFGYFYFYIIITIFPWFLYLKGKTEEAEHDFFLITSAFFLLDLLYIFLPVQGPKYFFPGLREGYRGNFTGFFFTGFLLGPVSSMNLAGAAFPSAHVLVTTITNGLVMKRNRTAGLALLPLSGLLFFSTVYIYAHYAVDMIGGVLLAGPVYLLVRRLYEPLERLGAHSGRTVGESLLGWRKAVRRTGRTAH